MRTTTTTATAATGTREAVLAALASGGEMTAAQVADAARIGRSTATRTLTSLATGGQVARTAGGRDGARRLPDQWTVSAPPTTTAATTAGTARVRTAKRTAGGEPRDRLRPGELAGQVLGYLHDYPGEHSPTAIAAGLGGRSGGAVSNALARLADRGEVTLTQDRPRRYAAATG